MQIMILHRVTDGRSDLSQSFESYLRLLIINAPIGQNFNNLIMRETKGKEERKYKKVGYSDRAILLQKIMFEGKSIKQAAQQTQVNYSTAKTILAVYRKKLRALKKNKSAALFLPSTMSSSTSCGWCGFRPNPEATQTVTQISSIGGKQELAFKRCGYRSSTAGTVNIVCTVIDQSSQS